MKSYVQNISGNQKQIFEYYENYNLVFPHYGQYGTRFFIPSAPVSTAGGWHRNDNGKWSSIS